MILRQLERDYERILRYAVVTDPDDDQEVGLAPPSMFAEKPVRWQVELGANGTFRRFQMLSGGKAKNDRGKPLLVPFIVRTVNISPLLLADTPAYVLGVEEGAKNAAVKHQAFKDLVHRCAEDTGNLDIQAVSSFLNWWDTTDARPALPTELLPTDTITFEVRNDWPLEAPDVRAFWAKTCADGAKISRPMQCLVCGEQRPAVESMPVPVRGIPKGQPTGTALVSANSVVYESYGLQRAATSPICSRCAERFGKALNALLAGRSTSKRVGDLVHVFWTSEGDCEAARLVSSSRLDPENVRSLLDAVKQGDSRILDDPNAFYGLSLSATVARAVVRDWLTTTVGHVNRNVAQWFNWQRIKDADGQPGNPLPDWVLAASIYRRKANGQVNTDEVESPVSSALTRTAFHGDPLPLDLLHRAAMRNRAEKDVTYERAVLMTLVFKSREQKGETEENRLTATKDESKDPMDEQARSCGSLLAILEELQTAFARADNPTRKINATLVDRYYGAASSAPGTVFGTLLANAQAHLTKLRKSNAGAYNSLQEQLETVLSDLKEFPLTLNLRRQAIFSLGYYHQRAKMRAARMEGSANKKARMAAASEAATPTPNAVDTEAQGDE